ncbi:hypothetical protein JCM19039_2960 [Geomicrobium sp. JCM 19039]|nr:hypothetical protein [Geomicrobium sp. JCM 19039]GAK13140.1 hypothetical protein JCM19039_2960 [Geomicrobium sp. JCM 19039]
MGNAETVFLEDFTNELITSGVRITKVDSEDDNIVLEGAEFTLYDEEWKIVRDNLRSDAYGEIIIEDFIPARINS